MTEKFNLAAQVLLSQRLENLLRIDENTEIDISYITCAEYQLFIDKRRDAGENFQPEHWITERFPSGFAREPVTGIRSSDAEAFCNWLTQQNYSIGYKYRLPNLTEAKQYSVGKILVGCWCTEKVIEGISPEQWKIWKGKQTISLTNAHERILQRAKDLSQIYSNDFNDNVFKLCSGLNSKSIIEKILKITENRDFIHNQTFPYGNTVIPAYAVSRSLIQNLKHSLNETSKSIKNINFELRKHDDVLRLHYKVKQALRQARSIANRSISRFYRTNLRDEITLQLRPLHILSNTLNQARDIAYTIYGFDFLQHLNINNVRISKIKRMFTRRSLRVINDLIQRLEYAEEVVGILAEHRSNLDLPSRIVKRAYQQARRMTKKDSVFKVHRNNQIDLSLEFNSLLNTLNQVRDIAYAIYGFDFLKNLSTKNIRTSKIKRMSTRRRLRVTNDLVQRLEYAEKIVGVLTSQRLSNLDHLDKIAPNCELMKELLDILAFNFNYELSLELPFNYSRVTRKRYNKSEDHKLAITEKLELITDIVSNILDFDVIKSLAYTQNHILQLASDFDDRYSSIENCKNDLTENLFNFYVGSLTKNYNLDDFHSFFIYVNQQFNLNLPSFPSQLDQGLISPIKYTLEGDLTPDEKVGVKAVCSYLLLMYSLWDSLSSTFDELTYKKYLNLNLSIELENENDNQTFAAKRDETLNLYAYFLLISEETHGTIPVLGGIQIVREKIT